MIRCIITDDEPLARECISNYVREVDFLTLTGTASNPVDMMKMMDEQKPELIFLDIEMPLMNGIEFLRMTLNPPMVVITTAYPHYALEGFQLDVMDYLVKPITFNRFFQAVNKVKEYHQLITTSTTTQPDYFFIKCDYKFEKIYFDDILYIEGMQNYITIYTVKGKYITLLSLKSVQEKLDHLPFIRVHKSYIVSIRKIEAIEDNDIVIKTARIPISRNYQGEVIDKVVNGKLWKK